MSENKHPSLEQELLAVDLGFDQFSDDRLLVALHQSMSESIVASVAGFKVFQEVQRRPHLRIDLDELMKPVGGVQRLMQDFSTKVTEAQTLEGLERQFEQ